VTKENPKSNQSEQLLSIRIQNNTDATFDRVEVQGLSYGKLAARETSGYQSTKNTETQFIDDFLPVAHLNGKAFMRPMGFCGTPPIPVFQKVGAHTIVITAIDLEQGFIEIETRKD